MTTLPFFGKIDLNEDYFETYIKNPKGDITTITIDFDNEKATTGTLKSINTFLENLDNNINTIKKQLLTSEFSEVVQDYIEHHLYELASEPEMQNIKSSQQFIEALETNAVNINPYMEERFFSIDFTISQELTNYLLVVDLLENQSIGYITIES